MKESEPFQRVHKMTLEHHWPLYNVDPRLEVLEDCIQSSFFPSAKKNFFHSTILQPVLNSARQLLDPGFCYEETEWNMAQDWPMTSQDSWGGDILEDWRLVLSEREARSSAKYSNTEVKSRLDIDPGPVRLNHSSQTVHMHRSSAYA
jgi:hypothetical protein